MRTPLAWIRDSMASVGQKTYTPLTIGGSGMPMVPNHRRVERYGALFSTDFLACETTKARAIGSLPVHIMQKTDTGRIPAESEPLARLIAMRPNALMTAQDMWQWGIIRRDVFGTAYIRVQRDYRGRPVALWPIIGQVDVRFDRDTGQVVYVVAGDVLNTPCILSDGDIIVLKTDVSVDGGIRGRSIAELAAEDIGMSLDLTAFYSSIMENGNHFTGWLESAKPLDEKDIDAVHLSLSKSEGVPGAGGMRIFDRGLSYHPVTLALQNMSIVEQETWVLQQVCRACHVAPHNVYELSHDSKQSATEADIDFAKYTVRPEVTAIEAALQPVLDAVTGGNDSGLRVKFDLTGLLRGDFATRMDGYRIGVYAGFFTRAKVCEWEDIPPEPGMERPLQPTAYYTLDADGNPVIPAPATVGTSGQSDGQSGITEKSIGQGEGPVKNSLEGLAPFIADATSRIKDRVKKDGDTPRTREFADKVLAPIVQACALAGIEFDAEAAKEGAING